MSGISPLVAVLVAVVAFVLLRVVMRRFFRIPKEKVMELLQQGAQIIDVRTPGEFAQAHAEGSRNIPLNQLPARIRELDPKKPVVVCCASGSRSSMAKSMLEKVGFTSVHNAGPWQALRRETA